MEATATKCAPHLTTLRASALKMRIKRIRTLEEKYTDQARRHHRLLKAHTTRTGGGSLAASTAEHKVNVLAEAARQLEHQLVRLSGHVLHSTRSFVRAEVSPRPAWAA
jgi:hypothetical protein